MADAQPLAPEEHDRLASALAEWGVPPEDIVQILENAVFPPGVTGGRPHHMHPVVGIMIDQTRDQDLASLFEWRSHQDDETFATEFVAAPPSARVILCPHAPEAMLAYTVTVISPLPVRRRYLLLFSKQAKVLSFLLERGTTIWLTPHGTALTEWAREGTGTAYEYLQTGLPVGEVGGVADGIERALGHVGYVAA